MTTGGYDPNQNPEGGKQFPPQDPYGQQGTPPPGSYPPPAGPPQGGSYPPPPQGGNFPPPQGGNYPPPGGYPPPPQGGNFPPPQFNDQGAYGAGNRLPSGAEAGGLGIRFGARVIDAIIVGIVAIILTVLVSDLGNVLVSGLFSGILTFAYFIAMEVTQGRTLGKMILGLSVHGPGGAPRPSVQQSAIRNAFTLLSIIPIIGGILALVAYIVIAVTINNSPTKQGKHDELAGGTQVVKG
ncbi:RDD family protein [Rhodococcus sp. NPDC060176]|uniref:RDD family protein n=1 Tax=unclassified Rhodococcus (in: high G+C Gram-positive bacteria) TaxID=192944 RepID=UPI003663DFAB